MFKIPKRLSPEMYRIIRITVMLALASIVRREDPELFRSFIMEATQALIR
jgi:hypothetical protein